MSFGGRLNSHNYNLSIKLIIFKIIKRFISYLFLVYFPVLRWNKNDPGVQKDDKLKNDSTLFSVMDTQTGCFHDTKIKARIWTLRLYFERLGPFWFTTTPIKVQCRIVALCSLLVLILWMQQPGLLLWTLPLADLTYWGWQVCFLPLSQS